MYWEYRDGVLIKSTVNKLANSIEAPSLEDVVPDGQGGVRIKTLDEKIQEAKQEKLAELKQNYISAVSPTDARILQYQKRQSLGILTADDEADYQEALNEYKRLTELYRQKKAELEALNDLDAIRNFDTSIR